MPGIGLRHIAIYIPIHFYLDAISLWRQQFLMGISFRGGDRRLRTIVSLWEDHFHILRDFTTDENIEFTYLTFLCLIRYLLCSVI